MNSNAAWNNVVAMPIHHCAEAEGHGARRSDAALARVAVQQFRRGIEELSSPVFEHIDGLLTGLAERASDPTLRDNYIQGVRDLRRHRGGFQDAFGAYVQRAAERAGLGSETDARAPGAEADLSLVGEDHLERTLALRTMTDAADHRFAAVLDRLAGRLVRLAGGARMTRDEMPFGPRAMGKAMQHALRIFSFDLNTQLIFLKLFDKHVMRRLDLLYNGMDAELRRAGIEPRGAPTPPAAASRSSAPGTARQTAGTASSADSRSAPRWAPSAPPTQYFTPDEPRREPARDEATRTRPPLATADLLQVLGAIQAGSSALSEGRETSLLDTLQGRTGHRPLQSGQQQVIAKVQTLFDYVLQDDGLSAGVKTILIALQVPFTRLALVDPSFFQRRNHPAWQLLNELVRVGMNVSRDADPAIVGDAYKLGRLRSAISHAVQRVLREFSSDVARIGEILDEFVSMVEKIERRPAAAPAASASPARTPVVGRNPTRGSSFAPARTATRGESAGAGPTSLNDTYVRQASRLPEGIWMHYRADDGSLTRVRLSWRSPLNRRNLFVDTRGFKALELSLQELADHLRLGRLKLLA